MTSKAVLGKVGLGLTLLGVIWSVSVVVTGGFTLAIGGRTFTSHEPMRAVYWTTLPLALYVWAAGAERTARAWSSWLRRIDHRVAAVALTLMTFLVGTGYATTAAIASDQYGYVSEADLWLRGDLRLPQPWSAQAPWPDAARTFAPLGYRPAGSGTSTDLVPAYPPGLPLLMAAAKAAGGHGALFLVVPLAGAVLVLTTWGIGRRLGSSAAGLIAALFVASSPAFLYMLMTPMSDVPAAAGWAVAFYFLLRPRTPAAVVAGVAAGLAVLNRPNLIWLAIPMAAGLAWQIRRAERGARGVSIARLAGFALGVIAAAVFIAVLNARLYGSPFQSGYGALGPLFGLANVPINARNYLEWLVASQTPLIVIGLIAAVCPVPALWPGTRDRSPLWTASACVMGVWIFYCLYLPFDAWWFLRFFLVSWPFVMLGLAAAIVSWSRTGALALVVAVWVVAVLGIREFNDARVRGAFELWQSDREFVAAALATHDAIPERGVVFSELHSGSVRYYGGRTSLEFVWLDPAWLDRAVSWLDEHGAPSYALLTKAEVGAFKKKFAGSATLARLDAAPIFSFPDTGLALYALSSEVQLPTRELHVDPASLRSIRPVDR